MKKNGFVSTSLIYTFFIIFLLLMIFLLNSYTSMRFLLDRYKYDIRNSFAEESMADINLHILVWNEDTEDYELEEEVPTFGYKFQDNYSYCTNGSVMTYVNNDLEIAVKRKDSCYAYFKSASKDVTLKLYTKESSSDSKVQVKTMPNLNYNFESASCTNGTITFDEETRSFDITSTKKTVCEAIFVKNEADVILHLYKEDVYGDRTYKEIKYTKTTEIPGIGFTMDSYTCSNTSSNTVIYSNSTTNELSVESNGKNECDVYFKGGTNKVELLLMKESDTGESGYTTGLKYTRTVINPGTNYKYVGYKCNNDGVTITYNNGNFDVKYEGNIEQTTCKAYFNKYNNNVLIHYYIEKSNGEYEDVSQIPSLGYVYNKEKSKCNNNSNIKANNNIITIESTSTSKEECSIYYDLATSDINILVYVENKETKKYELSKVPPNGYEYYNGGCTNGASIEYKNNNLEISSKNPTVCEVYFR